MLPARGGDYFCEPDLSGTLEDISYQKQPATWLAPDEMAIEVYASGLNFKYASSGMGLLRQCMTQGP